MWPFKRKAQEIETRSTPNYTAAVMSARADYVGAVGDVGELTATVQGCVSLWEHALAMADVQGASLLDRRTMAMTGRALALRGDAVLLIRGDKLISCADWDVSTRYGFPTAYRVTINDAGGGSTETVLAGEVLHFRVGVDPVTPWAGQPPLRRASLTAGMLSEVETVLHEVYQNAPIGSQIVPFPESTALDLERIGADFRGRHGRVMMRESTQVSAAGGAAPYTDWKPQGVTPEIAGALPREMLADSRNAIMNVYGVLPALLDRVAQGPLVREAQRHLAAWTIQPIAVQMAEEAAEKLSGPVSIDALRPLQAYDVGGRARALNAILEGMAKAKEMGLSAEQMQAALTAVNWGENDRAA